MSTPVLVAIIAAAATLTTAIIAAVVALYSKKLERRNQLEQRHSEARKNAYDSIIAACDRAWRFRIKNCLDEYDHKELTPEEVADKLVKVLERQFSSAFQELRIHSNDMDRSRPTLAYLYMEAFERGNPSPQDFENARSAVEDLIRYEIGLRESLRKQPRWALRQLKKAQQEALLAARSDDRYHPSFPGVIIQQFEDGEEMWNSLMGIMREWDLLREALKRQDLRAAHWKERKLWPDLE
ncbi:hypothetical protein AB0M44_12145 [Streptosporangium subroseum]|uniref:hypothetical protein n=1 Tax=Streptosporangium subroseum TaxID=106412 RepID=UPI003437FDB7